MDGKSANEYWNACALCRSDDKAKRLQGIAAMIGLAVSGGERKSAELAKQFLAREYHATTESPAAPLPRAHVLDARLCN